MKITGIEIGEYRQFKNIKFDFIYPKGHPKEGQPLEKVCFIGQSGTGKTTLLNVIWDFFDIINDLFWISNYKVFDKPIQGAPRYKIIESSNISLTININNKHTLFSSEEFSNEHKGKTYIDRWINSNNIAEDIKTFNKFCLLFKDSIAREADAFLFDQKDQPQTFSDFVKTDTQIEQEKAVRDDRIGTVGLKKVVSLGNMESLTTWQYLLKDIDDYDEESRALVTNLVHKAQGASANKMVEELKRWIENTPNPRVDLAEKCLNPIFK